jgi:hypothetical protein
MIDGSSVSKFKIGDKVIVTDGTDYSITKAGSIGIVNEVFSDGVRVSDWLVLTGKHTSVHFDGSYPLANENITLFEIWESPLYQTLREP